MRIYLGNNWATKPTKTSASTAQRKEEFTLLFFQSYLLLYKYQYQYYKKHYFDGLDLGDERMVRTPFLQRKLERFFTDLVVQDPDSIAREADLILSRATDTDVRRYIIYKNSMDSN